MANPWFRLYAEFASDPKVHMLSESMQRRLLMLFCFRCNGHVTLQDEEVTFMLRVTVGEWEETKRLFVAKGFIDETNTVLNWDKRQFRGDSSAERVRKHREAKKQSSVTDATKCNVTVTPPDTDAEQNQNKPDSEEGKSNPSPDASKGTRLPPNWVLPSEWREWAINEGFPAPSIDTEAAKFRDWWVSKAGAGGVKRDWPATWRLWIRRALENQQKASSYGNRSTPRQSPPPRQPRRFAEQDYDAGTEGFVLVD